jgi:hypothetical protein
MTPGWLDRWVQTDARRSRRGHRQSPRPLSTAARAQPRPARPGGRRRTRRLGGQPALLVAAVVAAAGVVLAVGLRLLDGDGKSPLLPPLSADRDIATRASITPRAHLFGDTVRARLHVVVDRRRIDPDDLRLSARFDPYERRDRRDFGRLTYIRYTIGLRCLARACLRLPARSVIALRPARIHYQAVETGKGERVVRVPWPRTSVASRAIASIDVIEEIGQLAGELVWRADLSDLPAASYRVPAGLIQGGLAATSFALFLVGGAVGARELRRRRPQPVAPRPRLRRLPPLEHALVALEHAQAHGEAREQRKALESLSRELAASGLDELAATAKHLAWSADAPAPEPTASLLATVRELIEEQRDAQPA